MLDPNEVAQARSIALDTMAEVQAATHADHGSYTHLCEWHGLVFYAHRPVGRVLHEFDLATAELGPPL